MNLDYVFPHIDLPNEELTSEAQKNEAAEIVSETLPILNSLILKFE